MAKETERRFLLRSEEWRADADAGVQYRQGYLSTDPKRSVRVRIGGKEAHLTVKGEAQGLTRPEFEYSIPIPDAKKMQGLCLESLIEKTRYEVKHGRLTWEIDEYSGENTGLLVAEIETRNAASLADLPAWVGEEISNVDRYRNINLVRHPFGRWKLDRNKPGYSLRAGEDLTQGISRILQEQVAAGASELTNDRGASAVAVHEARKCIKRSRALLRLIAPAKSKHYISEDRRLQQVGHKLGELRDAQAIVETLEDLRGRLLENDVEKGETSRALAKEIKAAQAFLEARRETTASDFAAASHIQHLASQLEQSRQNLTALPITEIHFSLIASSIGICFRRGRRAFEKAYGQPESDNFHDWRKRVKNLRFQLAVIASIWPTVLGAYSEAAKDLEQMLGDDHNLSVMSSLLRENHSSRWQTLQAHIEERQTKLRQKARRAGSRLYAVPVKAWSRQLEASWTVWKEEQP